MPEGSLEGATGADLTTVIKPMVWDRGQGMREEGQHANELAPGDPLSASSVSTLYRIEERLSLNSETQGTRHSDEIAWLLWLTDRGTTFTEAKPQ